MVERPKFQFRMRDLFWAVSLMGASLGLGVAFFRGDVFGPAGFLCAYFGCPVLFASGVGCLVRRPFQGAICGGLIATVILPVLGFLACQDLGPRPIRPEVRKEMERMEREMIREMKRERRASPSRTELTSPALWPSV